MKRIWKNGCRPGHLIAVIVIMVVIGLISMSGNPLNAQGSLTGDKPDIASIGTEITLKNVNCIIVDDENVKWFTTDVGLASFDGQYWKLYNENNNLPDQDLKAVMFAPGPEGPELWIASPMGASVAGLPMDEGTEVITYSPENAAISGKDVLGMAAGKDTIRWIGTDKGISALSGDKWLEPYYDMHYPDRMFKVFPITSMVTNLQGDSLYVGTAGAGVLRVYRDNLDGISGASVYAQWGPIDLPSDNIRSVYIAPDGTKWFGTKKGIARHTGNNTLENWTVYTSDDGLIDDFVQAITSDKNGNIWFGTKAGISVFDGSSWVSYTLDDGLASNNILSMATDKEGTIWIGTDTGITSYKDGNFNNY